MPVDGEKLDELLSGYIDGQLDADELRQVEEALRGRKAVRQQLDALLAARESLVELGRVSPGRLSQDFTQRVLSAVGESRTRALSVAKTPEAAPSKVAAEHMWRAKHVVLLVASLAAVLLLAINISNLWVEKGSTVAEQPGDELNSNALQNDELKIDESPLIARQSPDAADALTEDSAPTLPVSYLGDIEAPILFAYVMHVRPTASALHSGMIESLLMQAGIRAVAPIVANAHVEEALRDTSMIVLPNEIQGESAIYFIRAESTAIDRAFRSIWLDTDNFPEAHYNLAMDNPQTRLMSKIAQSTGKRFTVQDSFAAPIAVVNETGSPGPTIAGLKPPVFVSAGKRGDDFGQAPALGPAAVEMSTVMIVVHLPSDR